MWEKAGVAVSVVYGTMPAEAYRVAVGKDIPFEKVGPTVTARRRRGRLAGSCACVAAPAVPARWPLLPLVLDTALAGPPRLLPRRTTACPSSRPVSPR